jgi:hypothetical protein
MKRQIAYSAMVIGVILVAYQVVDRIEQHTEAIIAQEQAFRDGCLPRAGETAVITSDGRTARCLTYTTPSLSPGMARQLVSAAAVEVTP